jgi:hypothetical protein
MTSSFRSKQSTKRHQCVQQTSDPLSLAVVSDKPDPFDSYARAKIPHEDIGEMQSIRGLLKMSLGYLKRHV